MSSINGISVKGITKFKGHEGEPLAQGNLYLNNKKIGFWSQDSWGGPDHIDLDSKFDKRLLDEAVISHNPDKGIHGGVGEKAYVVNYDMELLLDDYLSLSEDEQAFNKAVKKGYSGILIATDGYHQTIWSLPQAYTSMSDADLLKALGAEIEKVKSTFLKETSYTKHSIKIYRSSADFSIGEPINLEEITKKRDLNKRISAAEAKTTKPKTNHADRSEPER